MKIIFNKTIEIISKFLEIGHFDIIGKRVIEISVFPGNWLNIITNSYSKKYCFQDNSKNSQYIKSNNFELLILLAQQYFSNYHFQQDTFVWFCDVHIELSNHTLRNMFFSYNFLYLLLENNSHSSYFENIYLYKHCKLILNIIYIN